MNDDPDETDAHDNWGYYLLACAAMFCVGLVITLVFVILLNM